MNGVKFDGYNITQNNTKFNLNPTLIYLILEEEKKQIMSEKITPVLYYECTKSAVLAQYHANGRNKMFPKNIKYPMRKLYNCVCVGEYVYM